MESLNFRQGLEPSIVCCYLVAINLTLGVARVLRIDFARCPMPLYDSYEKLSLLVILVVSKNGACFIPNGKGLN